MHRHCEVEFVRSVMTPRGVIAQFRGTRDSFGDPQCRSSLRRDEVKSRIEFLKGLDMPYTEERKALRAMRAEEEVDFIRRYLSMFMPRWLQW